MIFTELLFEHQNYVPKSMSLKPLNHTFSYEYVKPLNHIFTPLKSIKVFYPKHMDDQKGQNHLI